ncbi:MAG: SurA N-terminal domain-containing protein [Candidatus Omnitrophica bacterium]|nr:SurA N-terminal domain-containing protein [Candidatus Omnitrophota bacterium]
MKTVTFLILLLVLSPGVGFSQNRQLADRVAAVVNNEVITQSEFDSIFRPIYDQIRKTYQGRDLQAELESVRLKLLNQLIEDRLVYQEARKLGITVSDTEIQDELDDFKSQFPDETRFEEELEKSGMSMLEIEKKIRERLSIVKLHQSFIRGKVMVSPAEVEGYYQEHQEKFKQKDGIKTWCITLRKGEEAVKKGMMDEAVKRKAGTLIAELKRGADFEELARKHSQDGNASQGGFLGFVEKGSMAGSIDSVLFSLPEGGFSDILETEEAYHIFRVGEKRIASKKTFEEAKNEIMDKLFRKKAHERFTSWMEELKRKSYISIR